MKRKPVGAVVWDGSPVVVCDDGTVWTLKHVDGTSWRMEWERLPSIPQTDEGGEDHGE